MPSPDQEHFAQAIEIFLAAVRLEEPQRTTFVRCQARGDERICNLVQGLLLGDRVAQHQYLWLEQPRRIRISFRERTSFN